MNGILFKPWKIKAIAEDDREWMTRRVIKPQPRHLEGDKYSQWFWCKKDVSETEAMRSGLSYAIWWDEVKNPRVMTAFAPYRLGEVVYIKEAWAYHGSSTYAKGNKGCHESYITYLTDNTNRVVNFSTFEEMVSQPPHQNLKYPPNYDDLTEIEQEDIRVKLLYKWWEAQKKISPLFMPEWAARYFIKITDIRAERLQEITEEDAEAEGLILTKSGWKTDYIVSSATEKFAILWNSINKDYPWESNPFVFVYSFKKAEK